MQRGISGGTDDSFEFHHHRRPAWRQKEATCSTNVNYKGRTDRGPPPSSPQQKQSEGNRFRRITRRRPPVLPLQSGIREEERGRRRRLGGVQARVRHLARKLHTRALRTRVASSTVCLATQELCADVTKVSGSYNHLQRFPLRGSVVNATVFMEAV